MFWLKSAPGQNSGETPWFPSACCPMREPALSPGGWAPRNGGVLGTQQLHHAAKGSVGTAPGGHTWLLHPAESSLPYKCRNAQQRVFAFVDASAERYLQLLPDQTFDSEQLLRSYLKYPCSKIFHWLNLSLITLIQKLACGISWNRLLINIGNG